MKSHIFFTLIFSILLLGGCTPSEKPLEPSSESTIKRSLGIMEFDEGAEGDKSWDNDIMSITGRFSGKARIIYKSNTAEMLRFQYLMGARRAETNSLLIPEDEYGHKVPKNIELLDRSLFRYVSSAKAPKGGLPDYILLYDMIWSHTFNAFTGYTPYLTSFAPFVGAYLLSGKISDSNANGTKATNSFSTATLPANRLKLSPSVSNKDAWIFSPRNPLLYGTGFAADEVRGETAEQTKARAYKNLSRFLVYAYMVRAYMAGEIVIPSDFSDGIDKTQIDDKDRPVGSTTQLHKIALIKNKDEDFYYRKLGICDDIRIVGQLGRTDADPDGVPSWVYDPEEVMLPTSECGFYPTANVSEGNARLHTPFGGAFNTSYGSSGDAFATMKPDWNESLFFMYLRLALVYEDDASYNSPAAQITAGNPNPANEFSEISRYMTPFIMAECPIIKAKYEYIVNYFKTSYGIDLHAIAKGEAPQPGL